MINESVDVPFPVTLSHHCTSTQERPRSVCVASQTYMSQPVDHWGSTDCLGALLRGPPSHEHPEFSFLLIFLIIPLVYFAHFYLNITHDCEWHLNALIFYNSNVYYL